MKRCVLIAALVLCYLIVVTRKSGPLKRQGSPKEFQAALLFSLGVCAAAQLDDLPSVDWLWVLPLETAMLAGFFGLNLLGIALREAETNALPTEGLRKWLLGVLLATLLLVVLGLVFGREGFDFVVQLALAIAVGAGSLLVLYGQRRHFSAIAYRCTADLLVLLPALVLLFLRS